MARALILGRGDFAGDCLRAVDGRRPAAPAAAELSALRQRRRSTNGATISPAAPSQRGRDPAVLGRLLAGITPDERVIELDQRQPEFVCPVWDYVNNRVTDAPHQ